jgi:hypothetical protein
VWRGTVAPCLYGVYSTHRRSLSPLSLAPYFSPCGVSSLPSVRLSVARPRSCSFGQHLMWNPRDSAPTPATNSAAPASAPQLDLLLLPGDAAIERVTEFNGHQVTGARVYRVSYSDGAAYYFWMQEPSIETDDVFFNR